MSRLFTTASSEYLEVATPAVTAYPVTMACWFYMTSLAADSALMCIGDTASTTNFWELLVQAAGTARAREANSATPQAATTSTSISTNQWAHAAANFAGASSRAVWLNGGGKGTSAVAEGLPAGLDVTAVGRRSTSTPTNYASARIAEAGVWNVTLTDVEVAALARGAPPFTVRPESLMLYVPVIGGSPEPDRSGRLLNMTVTGTSIAPHAPIGYTGAHNVIPYAVAAAATGWAHLIGGRRNRLVYA